MSHIETYSELCATLAYTTEPYSEPELSSKVWLTCKMIRHIQRPGIVRTLCKHFQRCLGTFRDIDTYWFPFTGVELVEEVSFPYPFLKIKKNALIFEKITLIVSIFELTFLSQSPGTISFVVSGNQLAKICPKVN